VTVVESKPHAWISLLQDAEAHLLAVSSTVARLGIADRQLKLHEQQVWMLSEVLRTAAAVLPAEQREQVMRALPGAIKVASAEVVKRDR
jgi:hypothetical protein